MKANDKVQAGLPLLRWAVELAVQLLDLQMGVAELLVESVLHRNDRQTGPFMGSPSGLLTARW